MALSPGARLAAPGDTQVLIVGAGPTGLVLALWLTRLGVRVRIIDKAAQSATTSRALAVQARTLELYAQVGLADAVAARGRRAAAASMWVAGRRVARAAFGDMGAGLSPYPYALIFPQDEHEELLIERLGQAGVFVERPIELLDFEQANGRVVARLRHRGSTVDTCEAAYVAGCDGAHSAVREALSIGQSCVRDVFVSGQGAEVMKYSCILSDPAMSSFLLVVAGAVLAACTAAAAAQSAPQDYPQWRGLNRDGAASAFTEPAAWPEALTRRWKVDVGEGYATPLVVADTVYVFTRRNGTEVMTALEAGSGKERWHTGYPAPYAPDTPAAAHGVGPKATPLFHHGRLYTLGITGIVSAFDSSSGKLAWQTPAAPEHPSYGTAVSPVGDGNLVIVHPGNHGPLTAFDANTGAVKWSGTDRGAYASPIIVDLGGVRQVVTMTQDSVLSVALADGTRLWEYPWTSRSTPSAITPILYGETLIVSSQAMGVTALKPARRAGAWSVDLVWETNDVSLFLSNPVVVGDTVFGLSEKARGQFFALDAKSGKVLWLGQPRQASNSAIVKAGTLLLLLNDDAELIVARSSRNGFEPLKRYTVADSATWAQPAVSGNRIFVKDVASLSLWTLN